MTDALTSIPAILLAGALSGYTIWLWKYRHAELLAWERKHIWVHYDRLKARFCCFIRNRMKSNARFMAWLNKPQKHGKPDVEWIAGQIKVFGDVWR